MNVPLDLEPGRAALLVVDVQERLAAAMPEAELAALTRNVGILIQTAGRFHLPVVVTEQYPRGLGHTIAAVEEPLGRIDGELVRRLEKVEFSACGAPGFAALADELGRDQWIVTGMETHVCVYQTARQLGAGGAAVHVVSDAVCSRTAQNRAIGLGLIERTGAILTSTEVVVFDLLGRAGTDDFKALAPLVK
jgi:nicotinamidase-related amidase